MIGPSSWGPHGWKFIHMVALGYPQIPSEDQKKNYRVFFEILQHVLPCSICSNNYSMHLKELPLTDEILSNSDNLLKWTVDLHNIVNKEKGKKVYDYDEAKRLILSNFMELKTNEKPNNLIYTNNLTTICGLIFLFITLVIIAIVYKKN